MVDRVIDSNIGVIAITDHALVQLHLDLNVDKTKVGRWRMNTNLLQDEQFAKKLVEDIYIFLELNIGSTERLATVWDALKAFVRGKFISHSSWKKKETRSKLQSLEKEIIDLEKKLAEQFDEEQFHKICQLKFDLHEIYNKKTEYALFRLKTNFYENGEKTGRLLAKQLKSQDVNNTIMTIRENNDLITSSTGINRIFKSFYEELYTSSNTSTEEDLATFFEGIVLPQISQTEKDNLDVHISNTEVKTAIMAMKSGRSPGVDGLLAEFYKKYIDVICPVLTKVLQETFECGSMPDSFNEAIISLIPKKDKDLTDPANYRPISLINVDCKILSKVLALRLDKVLPNIIHKDQVGFIKSRTSTDNMRRLLHLLWINKSNPQPVVALSLDAQKAFDRVEWAFLLETLSRFGFGSNFCR